MSNHRALRVAVFFDEVYIAESSLISAHDLIQSYLICMAKSSLILYTWQNPVISFVHC